MNEGENTQIDYEEEKLNLEREKVGLEREKLSIERDKVKVERAKARWSAISIVIPLVAVSATVAFGIWSSNKQAASQFELKAIEIIMNSDSPVILLNKSKALASLFPERFDSNFASHFDPAQFSSDKEYISRDAVMELFRILPGKNQEQKLEILKTWKTIFVDKNLADLFE